MRYDGHYRLAHELKKQLHEIMGWQGSLTHRQFIVWLYWLNLQQNKPTRDNYYQMQVACEVRRSIAKNPNRINTDDFKIKFVSASSDKEEQITDEEFKRRVAATKAAFMGFMTAPITVKNDGKVVDTIIPPLLKRKKLIEEQQNKRREQLQKHRPKPDIERQNRRTNKK